MINTGWLYKTDDKCQRFHILSDRPYVPSNEKLHREIVFSLEVFINTLLKRARHHWHSNTAGHIRVSSLKKTWYVYKPDHPHSTSRWHGRKLVLYVSGRKQTCSLSTGTLWQRIKVYLKCSLTWCFKMYELTLDFSVSPSFFPSFLPMQSLEANNPAVQCRCTTRWTPREANHQSRGYDVVLLNFRHYK